MGIFSKMRKDRHMNSKQVVIQDRLRRLKSTHMSMNLKEGSEYDRAIEQLVQLENGLRDTHDPSKKEALRIQIREAENKVDELLQRNRTNVEIRRSEVREFEQQIQETVQ